MEDEQSVSQSTFRIEENDPIIAFIVIRSRLVLARDTISIEPSFPMRALPVDFATLPANVELVIGAVVLQRETG